MSEAAAVTPDSRTGWMFLTNHTHVLCCLDHDPTMRLRDVAVLVGITERAAQAIVADLVGAGYLSRTRVGRRNHYEVHRDRPLRHHSLSSMSIGHLLDVLHAGHSRVHGQQRPA